jgi:hypothetical protein
MSEFKSIIEFNNFLIKRNINVDYNQYFKLVQSRFYPEIDISFMDYFLSLIDHSHEFIIDDIKLLEYNAIDNLDSDTIIDMLNDNLLIENQDYIISIDTILVPNKKKYILTPEAFKLCLMRTENTDKYLKYFLLHDKCFHYYNKLQMN